MKGKRFKEEQIIRILHEAERGLTVAEVWRILAKAHDTRNLGEYEGHMNLDERFVTDLVTAVKAVAEKDNELTPP